jgi:hypothetical protein
MPRLVIAITFLLIAAAPAQAAEVSLALKPSNGLQMGGAHHFSGKLTENGQPQAGQVVNLEVRRFPYEGGFEPLDQATTGDQGQFSFFRTLDRNHEVRVTAANATSSVRTAFVFPRFKLSFKALGGGRVRLTQRYRAADDAILTARTWFYLGARKATTGRLRARVSTKQTGKGRFLSSAVVRIPKSFKGRFRYATCLPGEQTSGMGDPAAKCHRKFRF